MIEDYILIIGAMKSGTTTLFDQLARDPRIAGARPKEPGFFAFEEVHSMGWDWYESLFGFEPGQHRFALDGSTDYTKAPFVTGVTERLEAARAQGRRFKLIYVCREPVSRLMSHARHTQTTGKEVGQFVSPRERHDLDAEDGLSPVNLAVSRYATQLSLYSGFSERDELFVTTTSAMAADGQGLMDALSDFLALDGLRWHAETSHSNTAAGKRQANPLVAAASTSALAAVAKSILPKGVRVAIKEATKRPVAVEGRFAPTPEERAMLTGQFADELNRLEDEHDVSVPAAWRGQPPC